MTGTAELKQREHAGRSVARASVARLSVSHAIPLPARIVVPIRSDLAINETGLERLRDFAARHTLFLLRLSLATIFFWFGVLKVANVSPVVELLHSSIPFLARSPYLQILGIAEITIGMGLLFDRLAKQATALMILHLLGTLSVFVIAPSVIFAPAFPVLTMDGEFVLKNVVLITSALVIMFSGRVRDPLRQKRHG
jgi:putative oxidoreductase